MLKASTSLFALLSVCGGALVVIACSSDDSSTFTPDVPKSDAEQDSPGTFLEAGPRDSAGEGGPTSCTASVPNPFTPTWRAPVRAVAACSTEELKGYWDACLANAGVTETDGTCANFKTAHATCAACAEPTDQGGPIQWQANRSFYTINIAGCITLEQAGTDAGLSNCGEAYNASQDCSRQSCLTCITEAKSFALFQSCQSDVKAQQLCKTYDDAKTAACGTIPGSASCFPTSTTEAQESHFTRVVSITCGP